MKRVFAFIGLSTALTLIVLNLVGITLCKYSVFVLLFLLAVSLLVKKTRKAKVVPITLTGVLIACIMFLIVYQGTVVNVQSLDNKMVSSTFQIVDICDKTDSGNYAYTVKTKYVDENNAPQNFKLTLYSKHRIDADYYQDIKGVISFFRQGENAFASYGRYGEGIYIEGYLIDYEPLDDAGNKPINYYIINLRLKIKELLNNSFDDNVSALAEAVFIGDTSDLSDEIYNNFRICGVSHVMAVSGLHTAILCLGIYTFLKLLKCPLKSRTIISLIVIFVYIAAADFRKPVIRAGIMLAIMLLSRLVNNHADTLNSLGVALFIICLNPFAVTDVSTCLTVSAVLGIVVIMPELENFWIPKKAVVRYFYEIFIISVSVIISTLPVLWLFFRSVSIMGIILNLVFIPFVQLGLTAILLFCIASGIGLPAFVTHFIVDFVFTLMLKITDFCARHLSFLLLDISAELFGVMIGSVFLFIALYVFAGGRVNFRLTCIFMCVVIAVSVSINAYNIKNQVYITVCDHGGIIVSDSTSVIAIDVEKSADKYALERALVRKKDNIVLINSSVYYDTENAVILDEDNDYSVAVSKNISLDKQGENIILSVFDKNFKIEEDCVTINDTDIQRDISGRFSETGNVVITVADNAQISARRDIYG